MKEGKDWDQLLVYVLFEYREVPQATTGFSLFELLYRRAVWGPLDILKETWEAEESEESVVRVLYLISAGEASRNDGVGSRIPPRQRLSRRHGMTAMLGRESYSQGSRCWCYYLHL